MYHNGRLTTICIGLSARRQAMLMSYSQAVARCVHRYGCSNALERHACYDSRSSSPNMDIWTIIALAFGI